MHLELLQEQSFCFLHTPRRLSRFRRLARLRKANEIVDASAINLDSQALSKFVNNPTGCFTLIAFDQVRLSNVLFGVKVSDRSQKKRIVSG